MNVAKRMLLAVGLSFATEGVVAQTTQTENHVEYLGEGWPLARLGEDGKSVELFCHEKDGAEGRALVAEEDGEWYVFCGGKEPTEKTKLLLMVSEAQPYFRQAPQYTDALIARCVDSDKKVKRKGNETSRFTCE